MARPIRLGKAAGELNVGISTLVEFLSNNGVNIETNPNTKLTPDQYEMLRTEFAADQTLKEQSKLSTVATEKRETISLRDEKEAPKDEEKKEEKKEETVEESPQIQVKTVGKIDLDSINTKTRPEKKAKSFKEEEKAELTKAEEEPKKEEEAPKKEEEVQNETETIRAETQKLSGPNVVGKIELPVEKPNTDKSEKRKRKRIRKVDIDKQAAQQGLSLIHI